jgi:integrase
MRQQGSIRRRGRQTYQVTLYLGADEKGQRKYHHKTFRGPDAKEEARTYLNKLLRDRDMHDFVKPPKLTLNQFLDKYLETVVRIRVRPVTFNNYENLCRLYIRPELGLRQLAAITPLEIQALYGRLLERQLSPRTIRLVHSTLHGAFAQAVKWRMLSNNPTERVDLPRHKREETRPLSPEEARRFLKAAHGTRFGVLFELLLATGLRPGEALGLKWEDVDLTTGRIAIQRSLTRAGDLQEPKTARARRSIPLPPSVTASLRQHRRKQAEERLATPNWRDLDLVFPAETGSPMQDRHVVRRYFKPLLLAANLPANIRLYDLRHTCATLLLAAGENPKIVSERLGHASVSLTLDTYSHVLPDMQESAASRLEATLYGATTTTRR